MDRTQRWTGCEHGGALAGIIQYQRNLDRVGLLQDGAPYLLEVSAGNCTMCRVDEACIANQAMVQANYIIYEDNSGFVARHKDTPILVILYRGTNEEQFGGWATKVNREMMEERLFWEFLDEDKALHGTRQDVETFKARHRRFESYLSRLVGLSVADRDAMIDAYKGPLTVLVYDSTPTNS